MSKTIRIGSKQAILWFQKDKITWLAEKNWLVNGQIKAILNAN